MRFFKYSVIVAAILASGAGVAACIWIASTRNVTNSEGLLLGLFISMLSILVSWLISHVYAELSVHQAKEDARANLRMYALKAAEKVTNLSNELGNLAAYLQTELDETSYPNIDSDLQGKNERIQSAIHIIQTLKSVNDRSLSDWEGVIADELDRKRERDQEREEELEELIEKVNSLTVAVGDTHETQDNIATLSAIYATSLPTWAGDHSFRRLNE